MRTLILTRYSTGPGGTRSMLHVPAARIMPLHGLECPWLDNEPFVSCIPPGVYALLAYGSTKYRSGLQILGGTVCLEKRHLDPPWATRYKCLFHAANYARELQGCIAPGLCASEDGDPETGHPAVWDSMDALKKLIQALGMLPAQMIVREDWT